VYVPTVDPLANAMVVPDGTVKDHPGNVVVDAVTVDPTAGKPVPPEKLPLVDTTCTFGTVAACSIG
jgi:hypothetical protein